MRIPAGTASSEIVIKRSRFIGTAESFEDTDAIKERIREIRELHPGCNHVVYAFVVGPDGLLFGMSDDREPKGTAGRPVLEVLKGSGLTNALVTVVRYFGGTKLGTGGLVRAYSDAARAALAGLATEELVEKITFEARMPYSMYEAARRLIEDLDGVIIKEDFGATVSISGRLPEVRRKELEKGLADLSGGKVAPVYSGETA